MRTYLIIFFTFFYFLVSAQEIDLANNYFTQGEYEKSVEIFKRISGSNTVAIHDNYLTAMIKLKDYKDAEKFVKKQIKNNPYINVYRGDLIKVLELSGEEVEAKKETQQLWEIGAKNESAVYELMNYYYKENKLEAAVAMMLYARQVNNNQTLYDVQLARLYQYLDEKEKMLDEVLKFSLRSNNISYAQSLIQDNIVDEKEIAFFEKKLYGLIQNYPEETFYLELLIWHFTQKLDFARAFIQVKALDLRTNSQGSKIYEIAGQAFQTKDYKNAAKMYSYIYQQYPKSELARNARNFMIKSNEEIIKNTYPIDKEEIRNLIMEYKTSFDEEGLTNNTLESARNIALLYAFYLNEFDQAIELFNKIIASNINNQKFKDQCKLDLGDIYILKDEPWESTLLYMQVEKTQKENQLAEQAKYKNAILQYYSGQFELSKDLLDVLKKATTREISNDALQLALLIQDNTGEDSTEAVMKQFSAVDLLLFQNKNEDAILALENLFSSYKSHSLADEILWLKATTLLKLNRKEEAEKDFIELYTNYSYDILADDGLFAHAKLRDEYYKDEAKAMELYRKLLVDFPGSVFNAQARIRFRELRGDFAK